MISFSASSQRQMLSRHGFRWFFVFCGLGTLLFCACVGVLGFISFQAIAQRNAAAELQEEIARIQSAGEPITVDDLYNYHRPKPGTPEITPHWLRALDSFDEKELSSDSRSIPILGSDEAAMRGLDDESALAAADAFLTKYDATIQATLVAARQPGECRFPVKFEAGLTAFLTHAGKMRQLARLFLLRSRVQCVRNDIDGSTQSIDALFAMSESLNHQLTLVEHLIRLAIFGVALHEVERVINEYQLPEDQLDHLQARVQASDLQAGLKRAMYGERANILLTFRNVNTFTKSGARGSQEIILDRDGKVTRPDDCLKSLELFGDTIRASSEPFPTALQRIVLIDDRLKAMKASPNLEKMKYMVTLLQFPATLGAFQGEGRNLASRNAVLAAIASERYRLKTGSYPSRLTDLVPGFLSAVPTDPFDGQPLRLIQTKDGLTIYCVGKDAKDDGGIQNKSTGEPDIVVQVCMKKVAKP